MFLPKTIVISTVIVDKLEEYTSVLVNRDGFHPDLVNIELVRTRLSILVSDELIELTKRNEQF